MDARQKNHNLPLQYGNELLVFSHGDGCLLYDISGKEYLDMGSGIAVNSLGYGRQDLAQTAFDQMKKLIHVSNLFATQPELSLANRLAAIPVPGRPDFKFEAVHFGNSGAEANETALKYARLYALHRKGRGHHRLVSFDNSFHGRTMGTLSLTANPNYREKFDPLIPDCQILPYNDTEALEKSLDRTVAAVIVEPVQGEGGLNRVQEKFARSLNIHCRKHDIMLIADEVQTGFGRCGNMLASQSTGLEPDIVTLAKPLAGGLPLSATLIPSSVNTLLKPGDHGTTFGGGPVTTAVASKVLDFISKPGFMAEIRRKGELMVELLKSNLTEIQVEFPGMGLLRGVKPSNEKYDKHWCSDIISQMEDQGVIILKTGSNVLRLAPPLVISDEQIKAGIDTLCSVIKKNL